MPDLPSPPFPLPGTFSSLFFCLLCRPNSSEDMLLIVFPFWSFFLSIVIPGSFFLTLTAKHLYTFFLYTYVETSIKQLVLSLFSRWGDRSTKYKKCKSQLLNYKDLDGQGQELDVCFMSSVCTVPRIEWAFSVR